MAAAVETLPILDPLRTKEDFRDYSSSKNAAQVRETYRMMHQNQTVAFVHEMHQKYIKNTLGLHYSIWELMDKLGIIWPLNIWNSMITIVSTIFLAQNDNLVDESEPDIESAQTIHAYQTAEALRTKYPTEDWLHLTGFLHDMGKILALPEFGGLPQWAVVGDTFPVGCAPSDIIVHSDTFIGNPDLLNPAFNSRLGIYKEHCGLDHVTFSFGHDEYLYHLLKRNNCKLPIHALSVIRLHSFYPWHTHGGYTYLCDASDEDKLAWVRKFNECDLYSKSDSLKPDPIALRPYYESLIQKYFPSPVLEI